MESNFSWEKLAEYFAGELTEEETQEMDMWIKADPKREKQVKFLYKVWTESENLPYQLNVDKAWDVLEEHMDRIEEKEGGLTDSESIPNDKATIYSLNERRKPVKKTGKTGHRIIMIAASVLIMLTAGLFTHSYYLDMQEAEQTEEIAIEELTTRDGERAVYSLNDGSSVILHAGSRLEVPVNFNANNREVYLEGEAYFEVSHDSEFPFIVHAEETYTRVLGTKFLVQAWSGENKNVEVIVEEGRVALGENRPESSLAQEEIIITQNQIGVIAEGIGPTVSEIADLHWHLGWTEGRLVFEDRQLSEILPRLERWYAVEIRTESDAIFEKRLTAEIDYSQPMMEVLTGIALSMNLDFEQDGRTFTFRSE